MGSKYRKFCIKKKLSIIQKEPRIKHNLLPVNFELQSSIFSMRNRFARPFSLGFKKKNRQKSKTTFRNYNFRERKNFNCHFEEHIEDMSATNHHYNKSTLEKNLHLNSKVFSERIIPKENIETLKHEIWKIFTSLWNKTSKKVSFHDLLSRSLKNHYMFSEKLYDKVHLLFVCFLHIGQEKNLCINGSHSLD